jgi:hypothetical protein
MAGSPPETFADTPLACPDDKKQDYQHDNISQYPAATGIPKAGREISLKKQYFFVFGEKRRMIHTPITGKLTTLPPCGYRHPPGRQAHGHDLKKKSSDVILPK